MKTQAEIAQFAREQEWGLCMEGNEEAFARWVVVAAREAAQNNDTFRYIEIGVAHGKTLATVGRICEWAGSAPFHLTGYDLGSEVCFDAATVRARLAPFGPSAELHVGCGRTALDQQSHRNIHFAFIDACHGAPCVKADFIAVAARMVMGGIIAFHDASPACQGHHHQSHCGTGIKVREALVDLGLLPAGTFGWWAPCQTALPGWQLLEEVNTLHGCVLVRKVPEDATEPWTWGVSAPSGHQGHWPRTVQ